MPFTTSLDPSLALKLISLDKYFNDLVYLYENNKFPKVLLLKGKKGLGKFTLVNHFLNYLFSKNEKTTKYNLKKKEINKNSIFYNMVINKTSQEVLYLKVEEFKNIKIEDIRNLKKIISNTSLMNFPRFIVIDEVEFLNENSANALLKTLEEPGTNNFFILIDNQQSNLLKTVSSRCLINNIFMSSDQKKIVIDYLLNLNNFKHIIINDTSLSPGSFLKFNYICEKLKISSNERIEFKISLLLNAYKKDKDNIAISLIYYFLDIYFLNLLTNKKMNTDILLRNKSMIIENLNNLTKYNLNIKSVLNDINLKLQNV
jgi:DNA polymerase-3 subunit delta'